jgi:hypothetical protein
MSELTRDALYSGHAADYEILVTYAGYQGNQTARRYLHVFFPGLGRDSRWGGNSFQIL